SRLLRELAHDLAIIRSRDWGQSLVNYLNDLVARGHHSFYRAHPARWSRVVEFLGRDFPRMFRRNGGYFLVAAALFFGPLAATWTAVQTDPTVAMRLLPSEALEQYDQMYGSRGRGDDKPDDDAAADEKSDESDDEALEAGFDESRAAMAGFYVQHNVGIALQCFARGLLLGVGTIHTLLFNGLSIGAVAGYVLAMGHSEKFLSFVVSHGSFELTAIAIAGAGGLVLGDALVHPGQRRRLEALRVRGLEAVQLAGGAAAMLVIAALIEAFWSPAPIPALWKYTVGTGLWVLVAVYLTLAGRQR
ncbi:MAG TPA: stage II sporulation protein M, partial [Planctomycetaceae bacterium]|nr:stage II sporulation protein M [Planctomycetaceae bacterium]